VIVDHVTWHKNEWDLKGRGRADPVRFSGGGEPAFSGASKVVNVASAVGTVCHNPRRDRVRHLPTLSRRDWLLVVVLCLAGCGSGKLTIESTPATPSVAVTTPDFPTDLPSALGQRLSANGIERANRLCSRMQTRVAPGALPSSASPMTAGHALQPLSTSDPARSWLVSLPTDQFVAQCEYMTLAVPSATPTATASCPPGSVPVDSTSSHLQGFFITEDGQFSSFRLPQIPLPAASCLAAEPH
jgi:hypothetical protein